MVQPKTKKPLNYSKIEEKWQKIWDEKKVFEAHPNEKEKYFFTTPYPYISGSLHIGHGRAVVEGDIFARYKRMTGLNVLFPMAFHITGTPVLGISSAIKNKDKSKTQQYEEYVSAYVKDKKEVKKIVQSFGENPQNIVDFFIPKMIEEYKQLGISVDWTRSFTSGDYEHQELVTWQFEEYQKLSLLKKGDYAVLYSPEDESAMGEDDIIDGDRFPVEKQEFTLLKFKYENKFLVAATLRPETIYGQTNLWMNPEIDYVEIKVGSEIWVMSKDAFEKIKFQKKKVSFIGEFKEELIGKKVIAPGINREVIILPSSFVDSDFGSGIVTSVPSDAPYDYIALRDIQQNKSLIKKYNLNTKEIEEIEVIPIIRTEKYGDKAGVTVVENNKIPNQSDSRLETLTQEVYKEGFHSGVLNENCGKFANMKVVEAKEKMKAELIKNKEADIMFETSRKARSRGGGKIIVAVMDNQWFIDFEAKGWKDKAKKCLEKIEIVPESYRKQFLDTFDWLDKRPCARRRGLGTKLPFDKDWIIESLSDSTIYMTLYTIQNLIKKYKLGRENLSREFFDFVYLGKGEVKEVAKKTGVKDSVLIEIKKSFEYWMPIDQRHTFSLHLSNHLSFMIFAFATLFPEKYWPKKITFHGLIVVEGEKMSKSKGNSITLLKVKKNYSADVFRFYMTSSSNIEGTFDWRNADADNAKATLEKVYSEISEAISKRKKGMVKEIYISKFNSIKKNASEKISQMKLREYNSSVFFEMLRLVKNAKLSLAKDELPAFYDLIAEDWIKLIAPTAPHIAEELWSMLDKKTLVSTEDWPIADESKINPEFELIEKAVEKTLADVQNILSIVKQKSGDEPEKVYLYVIPKELEYYSQTEISARTGKKTKVFSVTDKAKYDPENKSSKAKPGKPAIFVE